MTDAEVAATAERIKKKAAKKAPAKTKKSK
jgi:hypothetical protein